MTGGEFVGLLRETIRISRPADTRDEIGSEPGTFDLIGDFRAAIAAATPGAESLAESRTAAQRWHLTLHLTDAVLPGDRLEWQGRTMTILNVTEDRRLLPRTRLLAEETR